jgi:hypothetical protein
LPLAPISVEAWQAILSPEQMAQYTTFTAYDSLLSWTALETMQNHDFSTEGHFGRDLATERNLRTALANLYEGSTCQLLLDGGRLRVLLTVPGGNLKYWPAQIPHPEPAEAAY